MSVSLSILVRRHSSFVQTQAAFGYFRNRILGKLFGCPGEMSQAALPQFGWPGRVDCVVIRRQDTGPVADQFLEAFLASLGMNQEEGDKAGGHEPKPCLDFARRAEHAPACFINMIDWNRSGDLANLLIVRFERSADTVKDSVQATMGYLSPSPCDVRTKSLSCKNSNRSRLLSPRVIRPCTRAERFGPYPTWNFLGRVDKFSSWLTLP